MQPSARPGAQAERADGHTSRRRGGGRRSRELPAPCSTVHSHSSHLTPHYTILSNIKTLFPSEVAPLYSINYPVYRLFGHLVITNPHGRPISHAQLPQTAPATPHAPGTHVTSSWPLAELPLAYTGAHFSVHPQRWPGEFGQGLSLSNRAGARGPSDSCQPGISFRHVRFASHQPAKHWHGSHGCSWAVPHRCKGARRPYGTVAAYALLPPVRIWSTAPAAVSA